jgi:MoaA/NifB/PqqE/SkfB family radical SAM enzyme
MTEADPLDPPAAPKSYGERTLALIKRATTDRMPLSGTFELTHRCNLACVHCYVNLAPNDREAQRRELTTEEVCRVLDQLADAGVLWLTFSGGEPLLRADFADIYRYAHAKGFILQVFTNATLITARIVQLFVEHPPKQVEITQYGYTPETYDRVTDMGAQYDRFARGLERLRTAGIKVTLKAMALKDNASEVPAIRRWAQQEGLDFRFDAVLSPRIDGGRKPLAQRLSPLEVAAIEVEDEERQVEFADYCGPRVGFQPRDDRRYQCYAGVSSFFIDPYGKLHLCALSRRPGWDILRDGFAAGFNDVFPMLRAERRAHTDGCGSCNTHGTCNNCAGMAELEALDLDEGNLYFCQVTDARNALIFGERRPSPNGLVKLRLRGTP